LCISIPEQEWHDKKKGEGRKSVRHEEKKARRRHETTEETTKLQKARNRIKIEHTAARSPSLF
jgi:hypothetical protein